MRQVQPVIHYVYVGRLQFERQAIRDPLHACFTWPACILLNVHPLAILAIMKYLDSHPVMPPPPQESCTCIHTRTLLILLYTKEYRSNSFHNFWWYLVSSVWTAVKDSESPLKYGDQNSTLGVALLESSKQELCCF